MLNLDLLNVEWFPYIVVVPFVETKEVTLKVSLLSTDSVVRGGRGSTVTLKMKIDVLIVGLSSAKITLT